MANSSLTEDYLRWLEPQLRDDHGNLDQTYGDILRLMFEKEFVWLIPYDDNRVADGIALRREFCHDRNLPANTLDEEWPCSFLEVLIGISRRLEFIAGGSAPGWAWTLLTNLELHRMADPLRRYQRRKVNDILDTCILRTYSPDGQGGFFPLAWPDEDQTKVEIWYQMSAFINELHPEH